MGNLARLETIIVANRIETRRWTPRGAKFGLWRNSETVESGEWKLSEYEDICCTLFEKARRWISYLFACCDQLRARRNETR